MVNYIELINYIESVEVHVFFFGPEDEKIRYTLLPTLTSVFSGYSVKLPLHEISDKGR